MSRRAVAWLAWLLAGVSLVLGLAGATFGALNGYSPIELVREVAVGVILAVTFPLVGALVASRRPGNPLGWIFCVLGLSEGLVTASWEYGTYALRTRPGSVPGGEAAGWFSVWSWALGLGLLLTFALLPFPDGRPPSPRWRPVAWLSALPIAVFCGPVAAAAWPLRGPAMLDPAGEGPSLPAVVEALAGGRVPVDAAVRSRLRTVPGRPVPSLPRGRTPAAQVVRGRRLGDQDAAKGHRGRRRPRGVGRGRPGRRPRPGRGPLGPGRGRHRHPPLPAVRDRPDRQPHPGLRRPDRPAGRGVRRRALGCPGSWTWASPS